MINSKKAQEARNDLLIWYGASFALILLFVFAMYGFGFFGGVETGGLIDSNKVTAAVIAVPVDNNVEQENNTDSESLVELEEINV